jgi:hypothetical protein
MGNEPLCHSKSETAEEFVNRMKQAREEATSALRKSADSMKRYADYHCNKTPKIIPGQKVWLDSSNYTMDRPSKKLSDKRLGPFPVIEVYDNAVKLKLPHSIKIHPVVNISDICIHQTPSIPNQYSTPPPPVTIEGEEQYEVEEVLNSRIWRNQLQYLVKWKGYTSEHNTWEPESHLKGCQELVQTFHRSHPQLSAPQKSSISFNKSVRNIPPTPTCFFTDPVITCEEYE